MTILPKDSSPYRQHSLCSEPSSGIINPGSRGVLTSLPPPCEAQPLPSAFLVAMPYTYEYPRPALTVDCVIFGLDDQTTLKVMLIRRSLPPFQGQWALPGGFVHLQESLDEAAQRELQEETGMTDVFLEQLYTFGAPGRDPRDRVVWVAYYALVNLVAGVLWLLVVLRLGRRHRQLTQLARDRAIEASPAPARAAAPRGRAAAVRWPRPTAGRPARRLLAPCRRLPGRPAPPPNRWARPIPGADAGSTHSTR